MPIRILVLTTHLTRDQAGGAKAVLTILSKLASEKDFDVSLCCIDFDQRDLPAGLAVQQMSPYPSRRFFWRIPSFLSVGVWKKCLAGVPLPSVDVMYCNNIYLAKAYRSLFPGVPILTHTGAVITSQEVKEEFEGSPLWRRIEQYLADHIEKSIYRESLWTHIVSTPLVGKMRAEHFGLPPEKFVSLPFGFDPERFHPPLSRAEARRDVGLNPELFTFITVARLVDWKRVDMVLNALGGISEPFQYLVVGDGPARPQLEKQAEANGLKDRVHFAGWKDPVKYLHAANVFVLPSRIESFGLVYAEAMMTGLPCIGSKHSPPAIISSAEDVIQDGVTGFVIGSTEELREKLRLLLFDPALCERMGQAARCHALAEFSLERYVSTLRNLIHAT